MAKSFPIVAIDGIIKGIDSILDIIKGSIRTSEERLLLLKMKEVRITARAKFGADKLRMKQINKQIKQCQVNLNKAIKLGLDTSDIKKDLQLLLESVV